MFAPTAVLFLPYLTTLSIGYIEKPYFG